MYCTVTLEVDEIWLYLRITLLNSGAVRYLARRTDAKLMVKAIQYDL